jgi:hypothetical protein
MPGARTLTQPVKLKSRNILDNLRSSIVGLLSSGKIQCSRARDIAGKAQEPKSLGSRLRGNDEKRGRKPREANAYGRLRRT